MNPSHEMRIRSVVKAVSYRCLSVAVDTSVAYLVTRKLSLSITIVVIVNAYSTFLYYGHERLWGRIHWGLARTEPEKTIKAQ